ncbi:hypothetical protein CCACVL1_03200 [Corchorus capsularis]|uniref:Uncharacterized protein n=1 Tax=Corchorus capsularis TaxID=210143 RepID=A0A1R3K1P6_COCAP|nr:hypothetical protein CCACVL1_03200 [Corchorus capsularis]
MTFVLGLEKKESMRKKLELEDDDDDGKGLEIIKAVAQAWQSHSSSSISRPTNEFDAYRQNFRGKPSRFKLEAMSKSKNKLPHAKDNNINVNVNGSPSWDFKQSLWDSYEIVTVSKKLESGLVFDDPFVQKDSGRAQKGQKESKNSLRNLFRRVTSRRFNEADIPR